MEYMGNQEYWEEKFEKRSDNLLALKKYMVPLN